MPRWNTAAVRSRTLARLRDERGIALIMALGILFVLTITLGTVIYVTSASARHAEHSNAGQKAYALARGRCRTTRSQSSMRNYPVDRRCSRATATDCCPPRTTSYDTGTADWSGTLTGPLNGPSAPPWRLGVATHSIGTVAEPDRARHGAPVTRHDRPPRSRS